MEPIRRAAAADVEAVARLFRLVRTACLPYLPDLHTPAQDLRFFRDHVFQACDVWLAGTPEPVGFCAFRQGWVDHLYVRPDCHARGIGTQLLGVAMQTNVRLRLWAFQRNSQALRFYAVRDFREVERTDGSRNEEKEPDVLLEWSR